LIFKGIPPRVTTQMTLLAPRSKVQKVFIFEGLRVL
jgi:hypothetical protein